jgi:outer membrane protein assembly factor BamE (lipoprotein component of BamABCDE complex)
MKKLFFIIITFLLISNCTFNKVVNNHGVSNLEIIEKKLIINKTNKNDIIKLLGPASSVGSFDKNVKFYIGTTSSKKSIIKLGKSVVTKNDVLKLQLNDYGILASKKFITLEQMNKIKYNKTQTSHSRNEQDKIYDFFSSIRQKINSAAKKK